MPVSGEGKDTVQIPQGVTVQIDGNSVTVKGPKGQLNRVFPVSRIKISQDGTRVVFTCLLPKKKEYALLGTFRSHVNNMVIGVTKGFEYKMKVVYSHFPVKTNVKGNEFVIENFLGEKFPRRAPIIGETKVVVKGDEVIVSGIDKENVGQTAANIEQATAIKEYDPRKFQDGIYIIQKGGKTNA